MTIKRTKLDSFLATTKGKIFTAQFRKKDGSLRDLNCRKGVHSFTKGGVNKTVHISNGYITVFDMQKHDYRTLNLDSVTEVRFQQQTFKVID